MIIHPDFIGIDVSKDFLDIFDGSVRKNVRVENTIEAARLIAERFAGREQGFAVFEATGPERTFIVSGKRSLFDRHLRRAFDEAGAAYARVNPSRAREFAKAAGFLAKTDAVDARMLAAMGQCLKPAREQPRDKSLTDLAFLNKRRDQLVSMRAMEKTRAAEAPSSIRQDIEEHIADLDAMILAFDRRIAGAIKSHEALARQALLLRSAPGIGPVACATLLALLPELGSKPAKTVAALAGLAPFNNESGKFRGTRTIKGGRKRVRDALFMAAFAAIKSKSRFKDFYQALRKNGKAHKLALIAVARKLLITLNVMVKKNLAYDPNYAEAEERYLSGAALAWRRRAGSGRYLSGEPEHP